MKPELPFQRTFRVERLQAHDGGQRVEVNQTARRLLRCLHRQLRGGHRGQQGVHHQADERVLDVGHCSQSPHWL